MFAAIQQNYHMSLAKARGISCRTLELMKSRAIKASNKKKKPTTTQPRMETDFSYYFFNLMDDICNWKVWVRVCCASMGSLWCFHLACSSSLAGTILPCWFVSFRFLAVLRRGEHACACVCVQVVTVAQWTESKELNYSTQKLFKE